jgi:flagellar protein FlaG
MDITALHRIEQALPAAATPVPQEKSPARSEVVQAVKALNESKMFGEENDLVFQRDPQTRRMLIKVVNRKTREVINQVPPEYVLRLAADAK